MDIPLYSTFNLFSPPYETYPIPSTSSTHLHEQVAHQLLPPLPLQQLDNLLVQIPTFEDHDNDNLINTNYTNNDTWEQRKAPLALDYESYDHNINTTNYDRRKKQKIVHREVERQRRSEMTSLHSCLRSLLPHELIKGKRSMSDHLGEAVKYIHYLKHNLKKSGDHRDALKKEVYSNLQSRDRNNQDRDVKVTSCKGGVDVIVSTICGDDDQGLPLSKVIQCLIEEGLDVVCCISNKVDGSKFVHSIQAQVIEGNNIFVDVIKLQQTLEAI